MATTQISSHNRLERAKKFLQEIKDRLKNDTGAKVAFNRALSGEHHHLRKIYPFVLPYLQGIPEQEQDIWIFVACLSVYHDQDMEPEVSNFAKSCRELQDSTESKGPERRFRALLETDLDYIEYPIIALVKQMKSKKDRKISVYYPQLIADLCLWNHPDQVVQDRWAKTFWQVSSSGSAKSEETDDVSSGVSNDLKEDVA